MGPWMKRNSLRPLASIDFEDIGAGDVGGHEVGGELDAAEMEVEHLGDGADHHGLCEAGHADHEHMAIGNDGGKEFADDLGLADDSLGNLGLDQARLHAHLANDFLDAAGVPPQG